jgi:hypothetical protein
MTAAVRRGKAARVNPALAAATALFLVSDTAGPRDIDPAAAAPELAAPAERVTEAPAAAPTPHDPQTTQEAGAGTPASAPGGSPPPPAVPAGASQFGGSTPAPAPGKGSCLRARKSQCRQLTIMGTLAQVLGVGAVGTGVALMFRPSEPLPDLPAYERSSRPPGIVLVGMGVGITLTGVLMLVAGRRAWKLGLDTATLSAAPPPPTSPSAPAARTAPGAGVPR